MSKDVDVYSSSVVSVRLTVRVFLMKTELLKNDLMVGLRFLVLTSSCCVQQRSVLSYLFSPECYHVHAETTVVISLQRLFVAVVIFPEMIGFLTIHTCVH